MFTFFGGGLGAASSGDGLNHGSAPSTAVIRPVKIFEATYPVRFTQWALRPGSGGPGRHRGGLGATYEIEVLDRGRRLRSASARDTRPAACSAAATARPTSSSGPTSDGLSPPRARRQGRGIRLARGDRLRIDSPGGGGYGDPAERTPEDPPRREWLRLPPAGLRSRRGDRRGGRIEQSALESLRRSAVRPSLGSMSAARSPTSSCSTSGPARRDPEGPVHPYARGDRLPGRAAGSSVARPIRWRRSSTARRWPPTRCWSARASPAGSSPPAAFATCSRCAAETGRDDWDARRLCSDRPPDLRVEVDERTAADGHGGRPRRPRPGAAGAARLLRERGAKALVIAFINSYANAANEPAAAVDWPAGDQFVTASSDLLPEIREFERTSTAALNGYLQPVVGPYLASLEAGVGGRRLLRALSRRAVQRRCRAIGAGAAIPRSHCAVRAGRRVTPRLAPRATSAPVTSLPATWAARRSTSRSSPAASRPSRSRHRSSSDWSSARRWSRSPRSAPAAARLRAWTPVGCCGSGPSRRAGSRTRGLRPRQRPPDGHRRQCRAGTDRRRTAARHRPWPPRRRRGSRGAGAPCRRSAWARGREAAVAVIDVANARMAGAIRLISIERGEDPANSARRRFGGGGSARRRGDAEGHNMSRALVPRMPGLTSALGCVERIYATTSFTQ